MTALVRLAGLDEAGEWSALLSAGEKQRARAIQNDVVRARFVVSRGLRRHVLSGCTGRDPASLRFVETAQEKPRLEAESQGWDFNISHAGDHVALAVRRGPVGIDLETMREVRDMAALIDRYFHPDEAGAWHGLDGRLRAEGFFILWSAREAAMKCCGLGLAQGLAATRVDPAMLTSREADAAVGGATVRLRRLDAPAGCVLVVAEG